MTALESLNPFFNPALVSEMRAGSATVETNIPVSAVVVNSVSAISAEGVAIVTPEETPVPVVTVASDSELARVPVVCLRQTEPLATRSLGTRGKKDQASFQPSFQPDFEKLFNEIFKLSDMEAMLICADEELRVETLLGDRTRA